MEISPLLVFLMVREEFLFLSLTTTTTTKQVAGRTGRGMKRISSPSATERIPAVFTERSPQTDVTDGVLSLPNLGLEVNVGKRALPSQIGTVLSQTYSYLRAELEVASQKWLGVNR